MKITDADITRFLVTGRWPRQEAVPAPALLSQNTIPAEQLQIVEEICACCQHAIRTRDRAAN